MQKYFIVTLLVLMTISQISLADIFEDDFPSGTISYQGVLTDSNGNLLPDGTYNMQFTFYDAAEGGNILSSTQTIEVIVQNATFTAQIPTNDMPFDSWTEWWVSIKINGEILEPRTKMTSAPKSVMAYKINAQNDSTKIAVDPNGLMCAMLDGSNQTTITPGAINLTAANSDRDGNNAVVVIDANTDFGGSIKINDQDGTQRFLIDQDALTFPDGSVQTSAASGGWVDDGEMVRLATDSDIVGIGTNTPNAALEIAPESGEFGLWITDKTDNYQRRISLYQETGLGGAFRIRDAQEKTRVSLAPFDTEYHAVFNVDRFKIGESALGEIFFQVKPPEGNTFDPFSVASAAHDSYFHIEPDGKTGIGTYTPTSKLYIKGTTADTTASALNVTDSNDNVKFSVLITMFSLGFVC